jgi:PAS domain S-box-containing protein
MSAEHDSNNEEPENRIVPAEARSEPLDRAFWFETLYRSADTLLCIHAADGAVLDANPAFLRLIGMTRADLPGLNLYRVLPAAEGDRYRKQLEECHRSRSPNAPLTVRLARKNGGTAWVAVEILTAETADGRTTVLLAGHEITAARQREEESRRSEQIWRTLMNAVGNAVFMMDTKGIVLAVNPNGAAQYSLAPEEMIGRSFSDFLPADVATIRHEKSFEAIRSGRPLAFEDRIGDRIYEHLLHPITDESGRVVSLAIYSEEVTAERNALEERRKLMQQLQQAQKMEAIGTLAGGIAHDFNNLLMAIQGNVSLMLYDVEPSDRHRRMLEYIEKLVRSGADLTSKLLGYARKGRYEARPLSLNDLVRETSETFGRMRKDISITLDLAPDLKGISADKTQIEQVLLNLLVNAADAMPSGGKVTLTTCNTTHHDVPLKGYAIDPGDYVRLTVTDTGSGMPKEVMARIFEPFFTTKQREHGTGLGLASAYGIVKGHRGYIDVDSEVGKGSTFYVFFPAVELNGSVAPRPLTVCGPGHGAVLVVEDESSVLEVTAEMIRRLGYTVLTAGSGREAIARYRENQERIRVVVLDMIMPGMSGSDVYAALKEINPSVKVLLASGFNLHGKAREIMQSGCNEFIQKPFTMEDLALKLRLVLNEC